MTKSDKVLVILFRYLLGIGSLFALVPVVMPWSWMAATHRWLGLGEMPIGPIVEYLARSLSAFYALVGALCLVMASDLDRYRPLVRFFGVCLALLGIVFTGVDLAAGSLLAFAGMANQDLASQVGLERHQIGFWRRRWQRAFNDLVRRRVAFDAQLLEHLGDRRPGRLLERHG